RYLEQAVHIAPTNALYRSYLGKAMFEMDQASNADNEYELAIALDENDPTPYLYRAFSKVSQNQLVSALQDVEASIARNDNRAVYRSRLLLDQDSGTRSAGLSKVFTELGFNQAARVEAIKSIQSDYSNYSAHRLLAESYDNATLLDSRLSELRVASLLSPLSFNLFNSIGSETSFQNYDALFDKDEQRSELSFAGATKDDFLQGQALHTGKTEKVGYMMRYLANMRNGSKKNDFSRVQQISTAGQYQADTDLRIVADGSYQYLSQDFGDDEFDSDFQTDAYDASLGANLDLGPQQKLIAQVTYEHNSEVERDFRERPGLVEIFSPLEDESEVQGHVFLFDTHELERVRLFRTSVQYIQTSDWVTGVLGGQFFRAWTTRDDQSTVLADSYEVADIDGTVVGEGFVFDGLGRKYTTKAKNNLTAYDLYSYATVHLASWVDATIGGSVADVDRDYTDTSPFESGKVSDKRFNPKAGLAFYLDPSVTVRAAYFEGLRKSVLLDQVSLEPSMVAGMNQRFNDFALTKARNYGLGIDYKLPARTYLGVEAIHRNAREDRSDSNPVFLFDFDSLNEQQDVYVESFDSFFDQDFINAYWYQVLTGHFVTGVEYNYGRVDLKDPGIDQEVNTHKTKIGLSYIGDYGITSSLVTTWRQQDRNGIAGLSPQEDFWLTDVVFRYRLPNRHGSLALSFLNIFDEDFDYEQSYVPIEGFLETGFSVALGFNYNF
ncbi:MAG: TonB-dependent receptor, partial [Bdellovibrionales bacterium]|nr:TonB-dependent receptor [Bdellovibrionales bacterium]